MTTAPRHTTAHPWDEPRGTADREHAAGPQPMSPPWRRGGQLLSDTSLHSMTPVELALDALFVALGEAAVSILALRGARNAPLYRSGGDLDLACARKDRAKVERMLQSTFEAHGVRVVSRHRGAELVQYQLYAACGPGRHHHLCVDLHTAETCYGIPFLTAEALQDGRDETRTVPRPAAVPGSLLNFLTPYLSGGSVVEEYTARLEVVLEKHPAAMRGLLGRLVGTSQADGFCNELRSGQRGALARRARRFRRSLLLRACLRAPLRSAAGFAQCIVSNRVTPFFRPRGMTIALFGTDGTGKTTLGDALHRELAPAFRSTLNRTIKLRPGLFPQLGRFLGRKPTEEEYTRPHRAKPSGILGTWARASYYWLDYTLGYLVRVAPLRRRNTLILFDRWVDDWTVDPARYRMRADSKFVALLARWTPKPDVTLVTSASYRVVRLRKQEVSKRETLRQLAAYESFAEGRSRTYIIDTSRRLEDSLDAAQLALLAGVDPRAPLGARDLGTHPAPRARRAA